MRATPEDRSTADRSAGPTSRTLLTGLVLLAALVGLYLVVSGIEQLPPVEQPPVAAPEPAPVAAPDRVVTPPAPDIPRREPSPPLEPVEPQAQPLPPVPVLSLDNSDEALRETLASLGDSSLLSAAAETDSLVQRLTGLIDGLSRGVVMRQILPLARPAGTFAVSDTGGVITIAPASYARYDAWTDAIVSIDAEAAAAAFHRFRPLLEQAYADLGLPPDDFDNAVIHALDQVLSAPVVDGDVVLEQPSVMYVYADPSLESASALHRQLLRMGPENTRKLQQAAERLRESLLGQP
jgi:hypothetical protein